MFLTNRETTVEAIMQIVSEYYQVPIELIKSPSHRRALVIPRQVFCYLAKEHTDMSLKAIGNYLGGRDHSTIIYSINTVNDLRDSDESYDMQIERVNAIVLESMLESLEPEKEDQGTSTPPPKAIAA